MLYKNKMYLFWWHRILVLKCNLWGRQKSPIASIASANSWKKDFVPRSCLWCYWQWLFLWKAHQVYPKYLADIPEVTISQRALPASPQRLVNWGLGHKWTELGWCCFSFSPAEIGWDSRFTPNPPEVQLLGSKASMDTGTFSRIFFTRFSPHLSKELSAEC